MAPVSPVFYTEATMSIGLKNILRVGTFFVERSTFENQCCRCEVVLTILKMKNSMVITPKVKFKYLKWVNIKGRHDYRSRPNC